MNIFITDPDPIKCAEFLDDKRVNKMLLESTQMLCTALNILSGQQIALYKSTHNNHPCNVWARESYKNWQWLLQHAYGLSSEYTKRTSKVHACLDVLETFATINIQLLFGKDKLTPFPNCARNKSLGVDYTGESDIYLAYQQYLNDRWDNDKRIPTWYGEYK